MSAYFNQGPYGVAHYSAGDLWSLAGNLAITFSLQATTANPVDITGNLPLSISLAGSQVALYGVTGDLPLTVGLAANLSGVFLANGGLAFTVTLDVTDAEVILQPLWHETVPCADALWAPAELCDG